ncbi:hypothetical protein [Sphingobium yanoikuyae]|uniref:hypothetical protein n=1 Tax=Sphingobium yanoikuyae TaxID=13690 RepID=UPI0035C69BDE
MISQLHGQGLAQDRISQYSPIRYQLSSLENPCVACLPSFSRYFLHSNPVSMRLQDKEYTPIFNGSLRSDESITQFEKDGDR